MNIDGNTVTITESEFYRLLDNSSLETRLRAYENAFELMRHWNGQTGYEALVEALGGVVDEDAVARFSYDPFVATPDPKMKEETI